MDTNTNTNTNTLAISPITANLLAALRAYEKAVDQYYCAVSAVRFPNSDWPEGLTPEEQSAFDAGRNLIEAQIRERLIQWANTTTPAAQL